MCLTRITDAGRTPLFGYKIFIRGRRGILYSQYKGSAILRYLSHSVPEKTLFRHKDNERIVPVGKWISEEKFRNCISSMVYSGTGVPYPLGWHCFFNKKDAQKWLNNSDSKRCWTSSEKLVIRRVKVSEVLTFGEQEYLQLSANNIRQRRLKDYPYVTSRVFVCKRIRVEKECGLRRSQRNGKRRKKV